MKTNFALNAIIIAGTLSVSSLAAAQTTVTAWNFNNLPVATNTSPAASTGSGTASTLGMVNTYTGGSAANTSDTSNIYLGADGTNDWRLTGSGNGWNSAAAQYTQGAQFMTSTVGYNNVAFTYDWDTTTKGIRDLQAQFTTDGVSWTNIGSLQVSNTTQAYMTGLSINFAGITSVNNDANFGVRLVAAYDPTYKNTNTYTQAGTPTSAMSNTAGNWRFDNIAFTGVAIAAVPEPESYAMLLAGLGLVALVARRRNKK